MSTGTKHAHKFPAGYDVCKCGALRCGWRDPNHRFVGCKKASVGDTGRCKEHGADVEKQEQSPATDSK